MLILFLIPLTVALVSSYISQKCQDEIGYLISTVTVLSLILSLILAPWPIQVLLLIAVFASTNKFLKLN